MKSIVNLSVNGMILTVAAALSISALSGCGPRGNEPNVDLIQDMMETPAINAQAYDEGSPHHSGMRVPPEHTVPVGFTPYPYPTDVAAAEKNLKNPLAGKMDPDTLLVGQKYFETNCKVCHGQNGEGGVESQSVVASKMNLKPPTLLSDKVKAWPDAHVYHVITVGQGVMGPYASHIPEQYRWQVVNYIRFLEKQAGK